MDVLRIAYVAIVAGALVSYGAVEPLAFNAVSGCAFALAGAAFLLRRTPAATGMLVWCAVLAMAIVAGWAMFQALPLAGNPLAAPIWTEAGTLVELRQPPTISVQPSDTLAAIVPAVLPIAMFIGALLLFDTDRGATWLLQCLVGLAAIAAVFAIVQFALFPDQLMFGAKGSYWGSLTAPFVNRNTAATFYGTALVVALGLAIRGRAVESWWPRLARIALAAIIATALFLTRSRAGIAAALLGTAVFAVLLAYIGARRALPFGPVLSRMLATLIAAGVAVGVLVVGLLLSERVLLRAAVTGWDDARFCILPSLLTMLSDYWGQGSGLGTFAVAFPQYRGAGCAPGLTFDLAHSALLEGWITLGIPFVVLLAGGLALATTTLANGLKTRRSKVWAPAAGFAVILVVTAHSTVDFSIQIPGYAVMLASMLAPILTISSLRRERALPPQRELVPAF